MTQTTNAELTDVSDMYTAHRTFRREFRLMPELVRGVAAGNTARAALLAEHGRMVLEGLHLHHTSEDDKLWPKLLERCPPDEELILRMEGQHSQVEELTARLRPALDRFEVEARPAVAEEVASTFEALTAVLLVHLDEEERHILPLAARHVTQEEWNELGEGGLEKMTRKQLPLMVGAVLEDATPEEKAELYAKIPLPVRILVKTVFAWQYARYVRKIRG